MKKQATLSVCICNYNDAQYVGKAVDSVLSQSFKPDEVMVIDDGSTDNSVEIIKQYAKNSVVKVIRHDKNWGIIPSVNWALEHMSGEHINYTAADDIILPGFFEKTMNLLEKYPQACSCYIDTQTIGSHNEDVILNERKLSDVAGYISPERLIKIMRKKIIYLSAFATIIKKSTLLAMGGHLSELQWSSDRMFSIINALRYGICYIPEPLAVQLKRKESYGEKGLKNRKEHTQVIKNILELLKKPQYSDVLPKIKKSCALASLGMPMLRVLIFSPKHWDYLSFNLMRLILWSEFKNAVGAYIPVVIKKIYRSLAKNR